MFFVVLAYIRSGIYIAFENSNFNLFFVNILVILSIFLILSFFRLNLNHIFFVIFLIYLLLFIFHAPKIFKEIKFNKNLYLKIFFCLICLSFFFNTAYNLQIGWDGLGIWVSKANNFYNGKNYADLYIDKVTYIQYPHLGSYIWAFFGRTLFFNMNT